MVILGLGTNVENRLEYLKSAVRYLSELCLKVTNISPIYESDALLKPGAPDSWNTKFLNMVIMGETKLTPHELLKQIKFIEKKIGRQDRGLWAPREIDIDILIYDDFKIDEPDLKVPHPAMLEREFVLFPLADIAPDLFFDEVGKTSRQIADIFPATLATNKTSLRIELKNE